MKTRCTIFGTTTNGVSDQLLIAKLLKNMEWKITRDLTTEVDECITFITRWCLSRHTQNFNESIMWTKKNKPCKNK